MAMEVFDMLARRNADKLRAVGTDGASVRYHLRMNDGATGVIDAFELFDGVSLAFNNIPGASRHGTTSNRSNSKSTGVCAGGSSSMAASASEKAILACTTSG